MGLKHRIQRLSARVRPQDPYPHLASILAEEGPPEEMRRYGVTRWLILRVPPGTRPGASCRALSPGQRALIGPRTKLLAGLSPDEL